MLIGVQWHAHCGNAGDAVFGKDTVQLAARRFKADDERLHCLTLPHFGGNCLQGARQIIGHRQHIAGKARRGISACVLRLFLHTATHILRFGLRV